MRIPASLSIAIQLAIPALTAAVVAYLLSPVAARLAIRVGAIDMPAARKIHSQPIPRLGGLAVIASCIAGLFVAGFASGSRWAVPGDLALGLGIGLIPILGISILDDIRPVQAVYKFLAHGIGAGLAVTYGITLGDQVHLFGSFIDLGWLRVPLSILWLMGVTNAFNIIDGLDGLSAGLALISAVAMAAVFLLVGQLTMAAASLVLAGALIGFLPYNVHPARLFLGDAGATAIGFCLAGFSLGGGSTLSSGFAALLPVFILGLPIADTLITMARRGVHRLETRAGGMFIPDRNHVHHRLLALGLDHGTVVLILYGAGLVLAAAAFISVFLNAREAGLFLAAILLAGFVGLHRLGYEEFAFIRRGTVLKVYEMPAVKRGMFVVFVDIILAITSVYLSVGLKGDQWLSPSLRPPILDLAATFAPVTVLMFWACGMYRGSWRVAGLQDLIRACRAVLFVTVAGAVLASFLWTAYYPPSLFVIYGMSSLILTVSLRASYVVFETTQLRANHAGAPVLVYGAGSSGVAAVQELFRNSSAGLRPIGFIDDDARMRGRLVSGLPVFGTERELEGILRTQAVAAVLLTAQKIPEARLTRAIEACRRAEATLFRLNFEVQRLGDGGVSGAEPPLVSGGVSIDRTPPAAASVLDTLHVVAAESCPACASRDVHRSKARSLYERLWKAHTPRRVFRCNRCGWRGWLTPMDPGNWSMNAGIDALDLSPLDHALHEATAPAAARDR